MQTVMAIFAHPDDETFICGGALAKYAAQGKRVVLVCATRGEMGRRMGVPPTATRESIPLIREQELKEACTALGIARVASLGLRDKTLEIQPLAALTDMVLRHLREESPELVITFHEQLGGHPDHCTIGAAATRAFAQYRQERSAAALHFVAWSGMEQQGKKFGLRAEQFIKIDVSDCMREKLQAFRAHWTQTAMNKELWLTEKASIDKLGSVEHFITQAN